MGYKRIVLKLSGESLAGEGQFGYSQESLTSLTTSLINLSKNKVEIGIVVGAGNLFRGVYAKELDLRRTPADQMGMLATIMNGIALSESLEAAGLPACVMSSIPLHFVETFHWKRADNLLKKGKILIFVGGTSNPYFTTDTAAALRGSEIEADALLKATKVDGVFDKDPQKHSDAEKFARLTYAQALEKDLKVMDATSIALCRESGLDIHVFNFFAPDALEKAVLSREGGTMITGDRQ